MGDVWTWLAFFFVLVALLIVVLYQLMCLTDLEFDYVNPYDSASRINRVVLPEFIMQGVLCILCLVTGHWFMSLLSVPYLYYNARLDACLHPSLWRGKLALSRASPALKGDRATSQRFPLFGNPSCGA
ncbi:unnamed protein product [Ilex paraguariensis]|uniref:Uncharacterized protein n=1 Tax=Ilex paraguariensis TaxID=185542 RepID=A0ABC8QTA2_9AQUA